MTALSPRESEVAALVSRQLTDAEIAAALGISRWTVKVYAHRVREKIADWPKRLRGRHALLNGDMRVA